MHGRAHAQEPDPSASEAASEAEVADDSEALPEGDAAAPTGAGAAIDLDARLVQLDEALVAVQTPTRRYFASWLVLQTGLTASQAWVATTWDSKVIRGSYLIGTTLSAASLGLFLLQPKPALNGVKRFRKQPAGSAEEKQHKLEVGEAILSGQAKVDARTTGPIQHITGVLAALGSGLGVALGWDNSLKQAITRGVGVFFVAELQIITRPRTSIERMKAYADSEPALQAFVLPMLEPHAQGLMLAGTF